MGMPPKEIRGKEKRAKFLRRHNLFFAILLDSGSLPEACRWMGITKQAGWHLAKKAGFSMKRVIMWKGKILQGKVELTDEEVKTKLAKRKPVRLGSPGCSDLDTGSPTELGKSNPVFPGSSSSRDFSQCG